MRRSTFVAVVNDGWPGQPDFIRALLRRRLPTVWLGGPRLSARRHLESLPLPSSIRLDGSRTHFSLFCGDVRLRAAHVVSRATFARLPPWRLRALRDGWGSEADDFEFEFGISGADARGRGFDGVTVAGRGGRAAAARSACEGLGVPWRDALIGTHTDEMDCTDALQDKNGRHDEDTCRLVRPDGAFLDLHAPPPFFLREERGARARGAIARAVLRLLGYPPPRLLASLFPGAAFSCDAHGGITVLVADLSDSSAKSQPSSFHAKNRQSVSSAASQDLQTSFRAKNQHSSPDASWDLSWAADRRKAGIQRLALAAPFAPIWLDGPADPKALTRAGFERFGARWRHLCDPERRVPRPAPHSVGAGLLVARRGQNGGIEVLMVREIGGKGWKLPGGYADDGENAMETAEREVREETGLRARARRLLGVRQARPAALGMAGNVYFYFEGELVDGQNGQNGGKPVAQTAEIEGAKWVPLEEAAEAAGPNATARAAVHKMKFLWEQEKRGLGGQYLQEHQSSSSPHQHWDIWEI